MHDLPIGVRKVSTRGDGSFKRQERSHVLILVVFLYRILLPLEYLYKRNGSPVTYCIVIVQYRRRSSDRTKSARIIPGLSRSRFIIYIYNLNHYGSNWRAASKKDSVYWKYDALRFHPTRLLSPRCMIYRAVACSLALTVYYFFPSTLERRSHVSTIRRDRVARLVLRDDHSVNLIYRVREPLGHVTAHYKRFPRRTYGNRVAGLSCD